MERRRLVSRRPRRAAAEAPEADEVRRPGRPRSEEAHGAILDAAISLIREVGYDALTMDAIATRASVGKATVYRRWSSKETLVAESLERLMRALLVPDTGTTGGDLNAMMRDARGMYKDPATRALLSGLVAAMAHSERIAQVVRGGFIAARREALRQVLNRGVERGELRKGLDLDLALDLLGGPLFYRFLITGGPVDERLTRGVVETVLRGFAP
ncbi:TetR/AcrR family transcriptional regulator [Pyxidicoccus xibeiensis]|uniref:TetR/AcrR family transcriptional regulator n=1 Tax=Pyxidicoccus xibeiensis TaxID=2906759 RepID=UPI0020A7458C|nr:TetR/AcrR family transcriptional regulator [Pyxidicoccus xibeiensis]MCP3139766.1 TetR/AcrR family transcriptional regulator [Pyxidicoccus xibeiensis]